MEKIKNTLLPMFKGNAVLSDLFLQNFLDERPPLSLLEGPYETIDINKEMSKTEDEIYETITVPNIEDKYGGPSCICNCHQIEDPEFKSRYRHCIRCGTRFINGKVYIQTGRGLRPAAVSFLTSPNVDHNIRLLGKTPTTTSQRKKRSETSPSKRVTFLTTENGDEETEDEIDGKKKTKKKPPRKKKSPEKSPTESRGLQKSTSRKKTVSERSDGTKFRSTSPTQKSGSRKRTNSARRTKSKDKSPGTQEVEHLISKPGANLNQQKRLAEESLEWGENVTTREEPFIEMKPNSPDQQTAESESEFCEESSQDNCESDSNSSVSSSNNHSQSDSNLGDESSWKREEDKIILETFQKENDKEHAFKTIADQLKNRTVPQISNRFQTLMTLLLETLGTS
ncbi:hypothetical protein NQ317_014260 [Molorchus minor]|uniref:Myb-like domain-containing protein n=1 Tax=Molorchus minor TaxID=1323400 RepID=A0ABQ9JH48_9CUCU|nr:hypothetical protein NQ317_014260 [Molorchus minor]